VAVRLFVEGGPHPGVSRAAVVRGAHAMLAALQMTNCELSILLTGDSQIAVLNRIYRKKNRPTDVLAFAQREGEHGDRTGPLLGDVVVSVETARRQAKARGAPVASELTMLLAHGLLHLLGWDHETPSKDRRMRRETTRLTEAAEAAQRDRVRRTAVKPFKGQAPSAAGREPAARTSPRPPRPRKTRPRVSATPPTARGRR
jgi:probable rRNA maturation factor